MAAAFAPDLREVPPTPTPLPLPKVLQEDKLTRGGKKGLQVGHFPSKKNSVTPRKMTMNFDLPALVLRDFLWFEATNFTTHGETCFERIRYKIGKPVIWSC